VSRAVRAWSAIAVALFAACADPPSTPTPPTLPPTTPPSVPASSASTVAPPPPASGAPTLVTAETLGPGTPAQEQALNVAKAYVAEGRVREAETWFAKAAEGPLTGTAVSALLASADLLATRGDTAGAERLYQRLTEEARLIPEVQLVAGRFYWGQGKDATAVHALEAAVALQPDLLPAWSLLGIVQARAGRGVEAARTLTEYEKRLNKFVRRANDLTQTPGDRIEALELLSTVVDERCVDAMVKALRDPVPAVRLVSAQLLAEEDAPEALTALSEAALAEADPQARAAMALVFKRARDRAVAETAAPPMSMPAPASTGPR